MKRVKNYLTKCINYKRAEKITPQGLVLHSVGCNQPNASVFMNTFNDPKLEKGVHGFIDAKDTFYQTLPFNYKAWHCGGKANSTHVGIEMTEPNTISYIKNTNKFTDNDPKASKAHVTNVYNTAVEVFATLCVELKLNPRKDGVILSHKEAHARGLASNHGDPEHLWKHYGYTMDGFRKAVIAKYDALKGNSSNLPYKVKVTESELNVRKGAGTNYPVTTVVKKGDVFTIVEEKKNGTTLWGKLKSGAGWLSLKYTKKC